MSKVNSGGGREVGHPPYRQESSSPATVKKSKEEVRREVRIDDDDWEDPTLSPPVSRIEPTTTTLCRYTRERDRPQLSPKKGHVQTSK